MAAREKEDVRPRAALITNHGYAAPHLPIGGAPDTGGQNVYVHKLARALEQLGYDVVIFARGGFPHFGADRVRKGTERLSRHVRYVYVPGGGPEFLRKEDIAVALDEELDWLEGYVEKKAREVGVQPWEYYDFVNTHYWDAAVLGAGLVARWKDRIAARVIMELLEGVVPAETLDEFQRQVRWLSPSLNPAYHLGRLLLESQMGSGPFLKNALKQAVRNWGRKHRRPATALVAAVEKTLSEAGRTVAQPLRELVAAEALGAAMLQARAKAAGKLKSEMAKADRHVWTPHSLGLLKQERFAGRDPEEIRRLKFCERRHHEFYVSVKTQLFAATSLDIAERLLTHLGVEASEVFYFPPCVDTQVYRPYEPSELQDLEVYLEEKTGLDREALRSALIVFETSRMDPSKRKDLLLSAFALVAEKTDDVYLLIGGGPEQSSVFQALRAQLETDPRLKGRAFLLGYVPDEFMGPLFARADLYVSPSEMEGFGMSVAQAAASATAVVCTETIPFAAQYAEGKALLVSPGDEKGFAEAMLELLLDEKRRRNLGYRLAEKTRTLDWEHQTKLFLRFLKRHGMPVKLSGSGR